MEISKFYGLGILAAIAQKGFIDATSELQGRAQKNNIVDAVVGLFMPQRIRQQQKNQQALQKFIDGCYPILTLGNAFFLPGVSLVLSASHIFFKICQIQVRSQVIANPIKKKQELQGILFCNCCVALMGVVTILIPMLIGNEKVK